MNSLGGTRSLVTDLDSDTVEDIRIPEQFRVPELLTVEKVGESFPEYVRGCLVT